MFLFFCPSLSKIVGWLTIIYVVYVMFFSSPRLFSASTKYLTAVKDEFGSKEMSNFVDAGVALVTKAWAVFINVTRFYWQNYWQAPAATIEHDNAL